MASLTPEFLQSDKPVRVGSEVLIAYAAGDADVGTVTGLLPPNGVYVAIQGKPVQLFHVEMLAPYEDEDFAPEE